MNQVEEVLSYIQQFNKVCDEYYYEELTDVPQLIFLNNLCYYYANMLSRIFQPSRLYSNGMHIIIKINDFYYDACGIVLEYKEYYPLKEEELSLLKTWGIIKSEKEDQKIKELMNDIEFQTMELWKKRNDKTKVLKE